MQLVVQTLREAVQISKFGFVMLVYCFDAPGFAFSMKLIGKGLLRLVILR